MDNPNHLTATIPEELAGQRLDQALAQLFPDYSRARLQQWISDQRVHIDHRVWRPRDKVKGGERVEIDPLFPANERWIAQPIPLEILHEDRELLVVEKPAGLVTHPAAGNPDGTLLNALLNHDPDLASLPRAGLVHRLDKETSGLLVVARTPRAHKSLIQQLKVRSIKREYQAVVCGIMAAGGLVEAPIGRHPRQRTRMAIVQSGKPAITHYRIKQRFTAHTHIQLSLETGRTHQIRVHMAHIRHPLVGDPTYGGRLRLPPGCSTELADCLRDFKRQALHAWRLSLHHPSNGMPLSWECPLPEDMQILLEQLAQEDGD